MITREDKILLAQVTLVAYSYILRARDSEAARMLQRIHNPQEGDLVWEQSTIRALISNPDDDRWDGQFVPYVRSGVEEWETAEYGEIFQEMVHYCLNPDGTEFRWSNATILAVPSLDFRDQLNKD